MRLGVRLAAHERDLVAELQADLDEVRWTTEAAPASPQLVQLLAELLRCESFIAYRPTQEASDAWTLGERVDTQPALFQAYDRLLPTIPVPFTYDPLRPSPAHMNRAMVRDEIHTHGPDERCVIEDLWPSLGLGGHDQIRALICDDSLLLAWVGGFRAEPFTAREQRIFSALTPSLRKGLLLRRRLMDASEAAAGLDVTLDRLGIPAVVADANGNIHHASASMRVLYERAPKELRSRVRNAIAGLSNEDRSNPILVRGIPRAFLVELGATSSSIPGRLRECAGRWRVSPRESEVLRRIVAGDANKEIALKLGIHEGSVERHTTSLLQKSGCDSRSRLVAKFWGAI